MLTAWRKATIKQQCYAILCFILAYFSPIIGLLLFLFMKARHIDSLLCFALIVGAVTALSLYSIDTILYLS